MAGRKRLYSDSKDRRAHVRPLGTRRETKDMLKKQADDLEMSLIDYMDLLATVHENNSTDAQLHLLVANAKKKLANE